MRRPKPITPYIKAIDAINPMEFAFHCAIRPALRLVMVGPGAQMS